MRPQSVRAVRRARGTRQARRPQPRKKPTLSHWSTPEAASTVQPSSVPSQSVCSEKFGVVDLLLQRGPFRSARVKKTPSPVPLTWPVTASLAQHNLKDGGRPLQNIRGKVLLLPRGDLVVIITTLFLRSQNSDQSCNFCISYSFQLRIEKARFKILISAAIWLKSCSRPVDTAFFDMSPGCGPKGPAGCGPKGPAASRPRCQEVSELKALLVEYLTTPVKIMYAEDISARVQSSTLKKHGKFLMELREIQPNMSFSQQMLSSVLLEIAFESGWRMNDEEKHDFAARCARRTRTMCSHFSTAARRKKATMGEGDSCFEGAAPVPERQDSRGAVGSSVVVAAEVSSSG